MLDSISLARSARQEQSHRLRISTAALFARGVKVQVSPQTPVVTYIPADRSDLEPGAKVIAFMKKLPDGSLETNRVSVGRDGLIAQQWRRPPVRDRRDPLRGGCRLPTCLGWERMLLQGFDDGVLDVSGWNISRCKNEKSRPEGSPTEILVSRRFTCRRVLRGPCP